jgi:DNA (cytosine-5)-methyltransferase 1
VPATVAEGRPVSRPRLLDLFSGAGGAARGYQQAGFHVTGVDLRPQPRYAGDDFFEADALTFPLDGYDAIHASPPCQAYSVSTNYRPENRAKYPDLVVPTRERLTATGLPYVIENVPGAPLHNPIIICGAGLGMDLRRHRLFESNVPMWGVPCAHGQQIWRPEYKHSTGRKRRRVVVLGEWRVDFALQKAAAGIDWMTLEELSEAIPPAYTEHVGNFLLAAVRERAA